VGLLREPQGSSLRERPTVVGVHDEVLKTEASQLGNRDVEPIHRCRKANALLGPRRRDQRLARDRWLSVDACHDESKEQASQHVTSRHVEPYALAYLNPLCVLRQKDDYTSGFAPGDPPFEEESDGSQRDPVGARDGQAHTGNQPRSSDAGAVAASKIFDDRERILEMNGKVTAGKRVMLDASVGPLTTTNHDDSVRRERSLELSVVPEGDESPLRRFARVAAGRELSHVDLDRGGRADEPTMGRAQVRRRRAGALERPAVGF